MFPKGSARSRGHSMLLAASSARGLARTSHGLIRMLSPAADSRATAAATASPPRGSLTSARAPNFKLEVSGELEPTIEKITAYLKAEGFGVLTRINFHDKIKEKLNKTMDPCVILGACNPMMAYEAFQIEPDVTSRMPCNIAVRQVGPSLLSVEVAKPSVAMTVFDNPLLVHLAKQADEQLLRALDKLAHEKVTTT